jgi:hypothetical protein
MFSNPAAVKVPTFPTDLPVAAGASTAAVNAAIASCSDMGGGVVTFAAGTYALGSIHLKSNVKLQLNGATLRASGIDPAEPYTSPIRCQDEAHSHWRNAFLWGENLTNIADRRAGDAGRRRHLRPRAAEADLAQVLERDAVRELQPHQHRPLRLPADRTATTSPWPS